MEIYSKEKTASIFEGHPIVDEVIEKVKTLKNGEGLFISKTEWTPKTYPKGFLLNRGIFNLKSKEVETGWVLTINEKYKEPK